jgi:hypothetical protein
MYAKKRFAGGSAKSGQAFAGCRGDFNSLWAFDYLKINHL